MDATAASVRPPGGRVLLEVSLCFFYFQLGFIYSSWISRIPDTVTVLDISNGELGLVLVCAIFGGMVGLPLAVCALYDCINLIYYLQ